MVLSELDFQVSSELKSSPTLILFVNSFWVFPNFPYPNLNLRRKHAFRFGYLSKRIWGLKAESLWVLFFMLVCYMGVHQNCVFSTLKCLARRWKIFIRWEDLEMFFFFKKIKLCEYICVLWLSLYWIVREFSLTVVFCCSFKKFLTEVF